MTADSSQLEVLELNQTPKVLFATIPSVILPCIHQFVQLSLFPGSCYIASMNWAFVSGPKPGRANNKVTLAFVLGRGSVTYSTDRENSVSKIFIISLRLIRRAGKETSHSQAEGSAATKIAVPKFQKLNLFGC